MPCVETIRVWYDEKQKPIAYRLRCEGNCDDEKPCKPKSETEADSKQSTTREYCACDGKENKKTCHIVHYIVKDAQQKVTDEYFKCEHPEPDPCAAGTRCAPRPVDRGEFPIPEKGEKYSDKSVPLKMGQWIDWRCECRDVNDFPPK